MSEFHQNLRYGVAPLAAALLLSVSGCQAPEIRSATECVLTQPTLVGAQTINGYPGVPEEGVIFETIRPYGVSAKEFDENYVGASATAKVIKRQLFESEEKQKHPHVAEVNSNSIIAFCFTVEDLSKPGEKGKVWSYETPTAGKFGTVAVRKQVDVPKNFRAALKKYPEARAFKVNPAQTELLPLTYDR